MDARIIEKMRELEKTAPDFWNITPDIGNMLNILIRVSNSKKCLELGTSNGYSGIWFTEALKAIGGHLTTIEFYENRIDLAKENIAYCGLTDYITFLQGRALDVVTELDDVYDFVFVDANKAQYIDYFRVLDPKLKSGGLFVADNVFSHSEKVKDFIDEITNSNYRIEYLNFGGGVLIGYKLP